MPIGENSFKRDRKSLYLENRRLITDTDQKLFLLPAGWYNG
jgi:hypothetical protein